MVKVSIQSFKKAIENSGGVKALIAQRLNVSRSAVTQFTGRHPELNELLENERQTIVDIAETKLINKLNNNEDWAIRHILNSKRAIDRGLNEKPQVQLIGEQKNTEINIILPKEVVEILENEQRNGGFYPNT